MARSFLAIWLVFGANFARFSRVRVFDEKMRFVGLVQRTRPKIGYFCVGGDNKLGKLCVETLMSAFMYVCNQNVMFYNVYANLAHTNTNSHKSIKTGGAT